MHVLEATEDTGNGGFQPVCVIRYLTLIGKIKLVSGH